MLHQRGSLKIRLRGLPIINSLRLADLYIDPNVVVSVSDGHIYRS